MVRCYTEANRFHRLDVVDVGCGGGTYSAAWLELGANSVRGIDFSEQMLAAAQEHTGGDSRLSFSRGEAANTGLPSNLSDVVFQRAVLHHLADTKPALQEAVRLLRPGGTLIVQDRTSEDVQQPGSPRHPRGYLFEAYPRLLDVELRRRPDSQLLEQQMNAVGLCGIQVDNFWEVRAVHQDRSAYLDDVAARTGRSILHDLDNYALDNLVDYLRTRLPEGPVVEADRWTIWSGTIDPSS